MSVLDEVLQEEFDRSIRMKAAIEKELKTLPQGYISRKLINDKSYCYLQKRVGSKIQSTYLSADKVNDVKKQIEKRRALEDSLKEINDNLKTLRRVVK